MFVCYLLTASICFVALLGDKLLETFKVDFIKALVDNSTHGLIGLLSWAAAASYLPSRRYSLTGNRLVDAILCGVIASVIDLDHFCAAKSLSLQAATSLEKRPPLHCTTYWLIGLFLTFVASDVFRLEWLAILSWMTALAALSHHIRDAARRGLWLWPIGSTPAIPYVLYITLLAALPVATAYAIAHLKISTPVPQLSNPISMV